MLVLSALLLLFPVVSAQESAAEAQFAADSLRYRTALHYDPLLDGPLESLVKLYVSAERTEELIGLYRSHIEQYPKDAGAKAVLARILRRVDPARAEAFIAESVPLHPNFAPLQYVLFRFLEDRGDPRANEVLSRAIELESNATRRYEWLDQLLRLSESASERALAQAHFDKWLAPQDLPIDTLLGLARLMQRHQFWQSSTVALNRAAALQPPAETEVNIQYMLAVALSHEGKSTEAGRMLDTLLKRLAPDHWRRREILSLRLQVVATPEGRLKTIAAFKEAYLKNPDSESAVLDYAEVLTAGELRSEALDVLLEASARLPKSALLEAHSLELLDAGGDTRRYARYLSEKLENDPARLDLRFRLVKAQYALGQDAAAEQDFKTVVAGLGTEEASARILELQRYLRSIDRNGAAAAYLESYVRNHPTRLDVARELAEIRIASGGIEAVTEMVKWLQPEEAEAENVLDFSEFLLKENLVHAARSVIEAKLVAEPRQFELGLRLIEILGRAGDAAEAQKAISSLRELADTAPRYASWLEASIAAHRNLESLPGFLETELNRYNFDEGKWSTEKIDKFLILCESSRQLLTAGRVTEGVRRQLAQSGLEASHKLRLRKVLVTILESDPASAGEVEEQLKQLSTEDPSHRSEYELQRALVYHRSQRDDLAQGLLSKVDLTEVTDPALLREVSDLLVGYGFVREAETALATINRLEPGDLLSWERRVSLLATLGQESVLRSVIRLLRSGDTGIVLRELSNLSLEAHLDASYWRSIAALFKGGSARLGEVLPLLESADREAGRRESGLWSEWTRAYVLTRQ
ncbi:MAG TPA: hypothetical protein PLA50_09790, partial [Bacteroidia bacterium]|nr:hypothetical protein [Bacteroidia bacterium]